MVDDLVTRKRLDGYTRQQVEALLGPGDKTESWKQWHLAYRLGPDRQGLHLDFEWLVVRFGVDGRVSEYRVVGD
jgi:hypothetical protein